jgi:hypothetical protein
MTSPDGGIVPDTKDWTWVLNEACPECGFEAAAFPAVAVADQYNHRLVLMLTQDDPLYPNWDQDSTAVAERYGEQDPATVSAELAAAATTMADRIAGLSPEQWQRTGRRSDGASFTVDSFSRYVLHDVVHHLWDVTPHN